MAEPNLPEHLTPDRTLRLLRLIWAALAVSQVVVIAVVVGLAPSGRPDADASVRQTLFLVGVGMLCVLTPVGLFIRNQTYKAHWRGPVVTPAGYAKGNIILFAILESIVVAAMVLLFVSGFHAGLLGVAIGALLVYCANYPTGKPMQPHGPAVVEPGKP